VHNCGPGYLSRYSDSLRAGRPVARIRVEATYSASIHTGPEAYPAPYKISTGYIFRSKAAEVGLDYPRPSSADVQERVELYLYSSCGPSWFKMLSHSASEDIFLYELRNYSNLSAKCLKQKY